MGEVLFVLVSVVGGILLVGFLIGLFVGKASGRKAAGNFTRCRTCGRSMRLNLSSCSYCGTPLSQPFSALKLSLPGQFDLVRRAIRSWHKNGQIDEQQRDDLLALVDEDQNRGAQATAAAPDPTTPPESPTPSTRTSDVEALLKPAAQKRESAPEPAILTPKAVPPDELTKPPVEVEVETSAGPGEVSEGKLVRWPRDRADSPSSPRRTLGEILHSFMDERNIRWGELISGLLIVGSAIGLVISLKATQLGELPYFLSLIFMLITSAIFGAGMYSLKKWKLKTASRSVLIVTTLLIPLNFLAGAWEGTASASPIETSDPIYLLALILGLGVLGTISCFASMALVPSGWWRLWLAIMGPSVGQLIINRAAGPQMTDLTVGLLCALPLGSFLCANLSQWQLASQWKKITPRRGETCFQVLGIGAFSLILPGILLAYFAEDVVGTMQQMAWAITLAACAVLAIGILVHQRAYQLFSSQLRMTATATALSGGALVGMSLLLAWPTPEQMQLVSLLGGGALLLLSISGRFAATLPSAFILTAVGLWLSLGLITGQYENVPYEQLGSRHLQLVLNGLTSIFLMIYGIALLVVSRKAFARQDADFRKLASWSGYGASCLSVLAALLITMIAGANQSWGLEHHADWAGLVLVLYAAALIAAGFQLRSAWVNLSGSILLFAAMLEVVFVNEWIGSLVDSTGLQLLHPLLVVLVAHGLSCLTLALLQKRYAASQGTSAEQPFNHYRQLANCGLVTTVIAVPFALLVTDGTFFTHAAYLLVISMTFLLAAMVTSDSRLSAVFQLGTMAATMLATIGWSQQSDWFTADTWLTLEHLRAHLLTLSLLGIAWSLVHWSWQRQQGWQKLIPLANPRMHTAPLVIANGAMLLVLGLMTVTAILYETAPTVFSDPRGWDILILGRSPQLMDWGCWLLLAIAWVVELKLGRSRASQIGLLAALAAVVLLAALTGRENYLVGHIVRWVPALLGLAAASWLSWSRTRPGTLHGPDGDDPAQELLALRCRLLALAVGIPLLVFSAWSLLYQLSGVLPQPVHQSSVLAGMLPGFLYAGPLAVFSLTLLLLAFSTARLGYMLAAAICWQLGIFPSWPTVAAMIHPGEGLPSLWSHSDFFSVVTLNFLGAFLFVLIWRSVGHCQQRLGDRQDETPVQARSELTSVHLFFAVGSALFYGVLAVLAVLNSQVSLEVPSWISTLAVGAMLGSCFYYPGDASRHVERNLLLLSLMVTGAWLANESWLVDGEQSRMLTTLGSSWLAVCGLVTAWWGYDFVHTVRREGGSSNPTAWQRADTESIVMFAWWLATWLATAGVLRAGYLELDIPVRAVVLLVIGLAIVAAIAHVVVQRSPTEYLALAALLSGVGIVAGDIYEVSSLRLLEWCLLSVVLVSLALSLGVHMARRLQGWLRPAYGASMVSICCWTVTGMAVIGAFASYLNMADEFHDSINIFYLAIGLLLATQLVRCLEPRHRDAPAGFFFTAVARLWIVVARQDWSVELSHGYLVSVTSLYLAGTCWWLCQSQLAAEIGEGMSRLATESRRDQASSWLVPTSMVMTAVLYLMALVLVLDSTLEISRWLSSIVPVATGAAFLAVADRRAPVQARLAALSSGVIALVFLCWAGIAPEPFEASWVNRIALAFLVLSSVCFVQVAIGSRLTAVGGSWSEALKWQLVINRGAALVAFVAVFLAELRFFEPDIGTGISTLNMLLVAVALVFLMLALLAGALKPERDPFSLTEKGRQVYVYLAELVGLSIFVHIYLSRPFLFQGLMADYWPFILLAIAFGGALLGELSQRRGVKVLTDPLQHTAFLLPIIPLLAIWIFGQDHNSSTLLVLYGLLNIVLAQFRRSFSYALGAALCANLAFWFLLGDIDSLSFAEHPQFWLIPPAISVLAAAQLNRDRLAPQQLGFIRYVAIVVIYLSSTSEMMIQGIGETLWPPIVLAMLSILGVLVGIGLQVRAFLYLGVAFLVISILGMVSHAHQALGSTWPWWLFLLSTGICLWVLIALRDRYQQRLQQFINDLREWES